MQPLIGYTERTVALDAVIRHQELIIKSLEKQLEDDTNGLYSRIKWWFWGENPAPRPTDTGLDFRRTIDAFRRGLIGLQVQIAEQVQADIDKQTPQ